MNTPPTPPHVVVGDEIYYRHPEKGVLSGPVASAGKDGVRVRQGDEHHGVTWEHLLGHKTRKVRRMKIVERGEDGFLAEDEHGQREYVSGEAPEEEEVPEDKKEAPEEKPVKVESMTKSVDQAVLDAALIKAGFTPSLDYIRATYGDHWSLRENPAVDALWTALADGRARTDEALQGLREDLHKTHIQAYTRSDGTFVPAHEDSRMDNQGRNLDGVKRNQQEELDRYLVGSARARKDFDEAVQKVPLPDWTEVTGVKVLRSGNSRHVAVPRNGRLTAANFDIIDLVANEPGPILKRNEVHEWLWRMAKMEYEEANPVVYDQEKQDDKP